MPSVRVRDNEPFEVALRRFKRTIEKTGLLTELRAREFYEPSLGLQTLASGDHAATMGIDEAKRQLDFGGRGV